jgi:hypothetical protein
MLFIYLSILCASNTKMLNTIKTETCHWTRFHSVPPTRNLTVYPCYLHVISLLLSLQCGRLPTVLPITSLCLYRLPNNLALHERETDNDWWVRNQHTCCGYMCLWSHYIRNSDIFTFTITALAIKHCEYLCSQYMSYNGRDWKMRLGV